MQQPPDSPAPSPGPRAPDPQARQRRPTDWASLAVGGASGGGAVLGVDSVHGVARIQPLHLSRTQVAERPPDPQPPPRPRGSQQEAEHLSHLADLLELAQQRKGSEEAALAWLKTPHPALAGETPAARAKSDAGLDQVLQLLKQS